MIVESTRKGLDLRTWVEIQTNPKYFYPMVKYFVHARDNGLPMDLDTASKALPKYERKHLALGRIYVHYASGDMTGFASAS